MIDIENQNQVNSGNLEPQPPKTPEEPIEVATKDKPKFNLSIFIIVSVLFIIFVLSAFFILGSSKEKTSQNIIPTNQPTQVPTQVVIPTKEALPTLSSSDDLDVLESELNDTDIEGIDKESLQIDQEIENL